MDKILHLLSIRLNKVIKGVVLAYDAVREGVEESHPIASKLIIIDKENTLLGSRAWDFLDSGRSDDDKAFELQERTGACVAYTYKQLESMQKHSREDVAALTKDMKNL